MIKKIKYGLITLLIVIATNIYGQNGFLSANHSYQIKGNDLRLYLQAEFSLGFGICDYLDTCFININNDTILINAIYDISGFNPQAGCTDYDTINYYNVPDGNYALMINSSIVFVDSVNNIDTVNVSSQLFPNLTLSIRGESFKLPLTLYPNPTSGVLKIDVSNGVEIESIELFDIGGKKLNTFNITERNLNISELSLGTYFLRISTTDGGVTKKVVIE